MCKSVVPEFLHTTVQSLPVKARRASDPPDLEWLAAMWVLGISLGFSRIAASAFHC